MFFGCASLAGATVLFHLIIHGFYKSFAFLSSAVELFDLEDEQDGEADSLDSNNSYSYYDLLSSIVFVSINAIPFTSPSISKEFMLLSGAEVGSDSLILLTTFVLFASPIDEGRDDKDDYETYTYYTDDLYVPSSFPYFITFSVTALGLISIFSASFLEEFFLDISFAWSPNNFFCWLDTKGSMLIFLPFFSIFLSDWDNSRPTLVEDFSFYPILVREDNRYQSLIFNLELWFYDEKVASISKYFYSFANFFILQVQDRAFLENFFVNSLYYFDKVKDYFFVQLYSIEMYYPVTLLFFFIAVLATFLTPLFFWVFALTLLVELYHFFENFSLTFYNFLNE
jgi:NADH-ubiquinone oxidoreductase chain 5